MNQRTAIIGAGVAGSSAAQRLAARGVEVCVFERAAAAAAGASGNLAGVFRPLPTQDDNRMAQLLRAGFLYGRRHIDSLKDVRHAACGVLHLARDAQQEVVQRRIVATQKPAADYVRFVEKEEAAELAGWPVAPGGWWFPGGGWVSPPALCRANLAGLEVRYGTEVTRIQRSGKLWQLFDAQDDLLIEALHVVIANGVDAAKLTQAYPLRSGRGQVSHLPARAGAAAEEAAPRCVVARQGYVTPAVDGIHCVGATLAIDDTGLDLRLADHVENLRRLELTLPGFGKGCDPAQITGRVGLRPTSPDRLPIVGALDAPGLWTLNGFGARGLVWAALCAELLAAQICREPLPVAAELAAALNPLRFLRRADKFAGRASVWQKTFRHAPLSG